MSEANHNLSAKFLESILEEKNADYTQTHQLVSTLAPKALLSRGLAVLNLTIDNIRSGVGDKTIVELVKHPGVRNDGNDELENTDSIRIGDIVEIDKISSGLDSSNKKKLKNSSKKADQDQAEEDNEVHIDGVITRITSKQINISLNEDSNYSQSNYSKVEEKLMKLYSSDFKIWVVKLSNSITYKRMESTMRKLAELELNNSTQLIQLLLGNIKFTPPSKTILDKNLSNLKFFNEKLNKSQQNAINFSLNSPLTVIHGPFGTGKTSTIVELIKQLIATKTSKRILVCGPSNISVDTILERLDDFFDLPDSLLRIGHPARLLSQNLKHSLDIISKESDQGLILKDIMSEIDSNVRKLKKIKKKSEKYQIYNELKELRKDLRLRSKKSLNELILGSSVVVATLHGSGSRELTSIQEQDLFDTVIIDEVSQSLEPQCWIPLISHKNVQKLIIAGDNKQLSPTIKIENEKSKNFKMLNRTLFDRLLLVHKEDTSFVKFLNVQYRMNDKISKFSSMMLYDNRLLTAESCFDITLPGLSYVEDNDDTREPLIWYDTQGGDFPERDLSREEDIASSKYNENECLVVFKHVKSLLRSGVTEKDIGIIAPYSAQVSHLKKLILKTHPDIEISTVDGFQGREKQVIVLSLVRSNFNNNVGFLKNFKRLNVSITRCQRQLCVIGDMEVLENSKDDFLKSLVNYAEENFEIRYPDLGDLLEEFCDI